MKATIRRFHSPDVEDLNSWSPPDPTHFGFLLQVLIGPRDAEGEESFDLVVCTPAWLMEKHGVEAVVFGRHHLLLFEYSFERVQTTISENLALRANSWTG
jgi:hypothetical protein